MYNQAAFPQLSHPNPNPIINKQMMYIALFNLAHYNPAFSFNLLLQGNLVA